MATRKAKWQNDYITRKYDRVNLTMPKGRKDEVQTHAEAQGKSLNGYINEAVDEKITCDKSPE